MNTPKQAVLDFINAHNSWEKVANARRGSVGDLTALKIARTEYRELVSRFCASSVEPQGVTFGDDTMHDPEREVIESVVVTGTSAIVHTKHRGDSDFVSDYEYNLIYVANEWRITSIMYVDADGKYECL